MILRIIESIANEPSSNKKLEILSRYKDNEILKKVLEYTYNPLINFYTRHQVSLIEDNQTDPIYAEFDFAVFPMLDRLASRQITGNTAIDYVNEIGYQINTRDRIVLNKILDRDLDMGIATKQINKVFKDLIPVVPYMRCSLTDKIDRITYPAVVQQKCDGMFVNVVVKDKDIKFYTRNGTEFDLICIKDELSHAFYLKGDSDVVLHGELLITKTNGDVEDRKIGNGLINSLIKKEQTLQSLKEKIDAKIGKTQDKFLTEYAKKIAEYDDTDKRMNLILWDAVPYEDWVAGECDIIYDDRLRSTIELVDRAHSEHIKGVESRMATCYEEAQDFYREQITNGYEGAVLKNLSMKWKDHTSPEQIKLKAERICELKVIGYEPGTGKYAGGIGALLCSSVDGDLIVSVGSGLDDNDRGFVRKDQNDSSKGLILVDDFDINKYTGTIISVKFNELITSDSKDTYSLFLPRFVEIREDKNEADSLETIKKM